MRHSLIRLFQKTSFPAQNSFEPQAVPGVRELPGGIMLHNDVNFGSKYPNGFLDLYLQPQNNAATLFYIHGGGYVWGDKADGDPNAKGEGQDWFFRAFLDAGYNIVSVNYAFGPEYLYPTPVYQLHEAVRFLQRSGKINTHKLFFGGGSAGGQLAGQFVNIQTNSDYAAQMGMTACLEPTDIKAVLFNSALLDNERFDRTDSNIMNFLFLRCGRAYFETKKLQGHPQVQQSNVIENITADFPPAFISDGNSGTFTGQAIDLHKKLTELGVKAELNLYPRSEAKLSHGFESFNNSYGRDNMEKMLGFLRELGV